MSQMTPREIVQELDKHIVGQDEAKRAVAIALRNRWRRVQVEEPLRSEITPKNILMIGPTGVGKTEISRRLARLLPAALWLAVVALYLTGVATALPAAPASSGFVPLLPQPAAPARDTAQGTLIAGR